MLLFFIPINLSITIIIVATYNQLNGTNSYLLWLFYIVYQYVTSKWCLWPVIIRHLHPMHGLKHPHPTSGRRIHHRRQVRAGTASPSPFPKSSKEHILEDRNLPRRVANVIWATNHLAEISWRKWPFFMTSNQTQPRNPSKKSMFFYQFNN